VSSIRQRPMISIDARGGVALVCLSSLSALGLLRVRACCVTGIFGSSAFDLGIFDQAVWH